MRYLFADTETHLIRPDVPHPPMVCLSWCAMEAGAQPHLLGRRAGRRWLRDACLSTDTVLVWHNAAFDLGVVLMECPDLFWPIWRMHSEGRIRCTQIRERLLRIAAGDHRASVSLATCAKRHFGMDLSKVKDDVDAWRKRYHVLQDIPVDEWPQGAQDYALFDALLCRDLYVQQAQEGGVDLDGWIADERFQTLSHCRDLALTTAWGMKTDTGRVEALRDQLTEDADSARRKAIEHGLLRVETERHWDQDAMARDLADVAVMTPTGRVSRSKANLGKLLAKHRTPATLALEEVREAGLTFAKSSEEEWEAVQTPLVKAGWLTAEEVVRDARKPQEQLIYRLLGDDAERTPTGHVSLNAEAFEAAAALAEGEEQAAIEALARYKAASYALSQFVPRIEHGAVHPGFFLIDTGRTSTSPNLQNLPRSGGVRWCFVPRPGRVFLQADFSTLEIYGLAYTWDRLLDCYPSSLTQALQEGKDVHMVVAAGLAGEDYETAMGKYRASDPLYVGYATAKEAGVSVGGYDPSWGGLRNTAKPVNFGAPTGLGKRTLRSSAKREYNVILTEEQAERALKTWHKMWPEAKLYFDLIAEKTGGWGESGAIVQVCSGRLRGDCDFSTAANSHFQGASAVAVKRANNLLIEAMYADPTSPLFGARPCVQVHDEFILSSPLDGRDQQAALDELIALMCRGAREVFGEEYPVKAEGKIMEDGWTK